MLHYCLGRGRRKKNPNTSSLTAYLRSKIINRFVNYFWPEVITAEYDIESQITSFFYNEEYDSMSSAKIYDSVAEHRRRVKWDAVQGDISDINNLLNTDTSQTQLFQSQSSSAGADLQRDIFGALVMTDGTRIPRANADYQYREQIAYANTARLNNGRLSASAKAKSMSALGELFALESEFEKEIKAAEYAHKAAHKTECQSVNTILSESCGSSVSSVPTSFADQKYGTVDTPLTCSDSPLVADKTALGTKSCNCEAGKSEIQRGELLEVRVPMRKQLDSRVQPRSYMSHAQRERMSVYDLNIWLRSRQ
ncbi:uncharacterized protein V2V93DRAFT_366492 [Kockiozyma suomiensis]|uniref:uncharacterized protein n=1 Tax=Kockiozyma suomiensis TaxID=1337062 RepID=UPI0033442C1B